MTQNIPYDSSVDTLKHIRRVNHIILNFSKLLMERAQKHDSSKLETPEKEGFDIITVRLKNCVYMSKEYKDSLEELKDTLNHHYRNNSHHPEHYERGVDDMDLLDLIEMYCDWIAGGERNKDGSIFASINKNRDRFKLSDQLANILKNTAERYPQ